MSYPKRILTNSLKRSLKTSSTGDLNSGVISMKVLHKKGAEMAYRVIERYIDNWYGKECDAEYIEQCQREGIPEEDIKHMVNEYGMEVTELLEEI